MDHLTSIFDNFVLGGGIKQTQENPLQLALVNNNNSESHQRPGLSDKGAPTSVKLEAVL